MNLDSWIALGTTVAVFLTLYFRRGAPTDLLFMGGLVVVTLTGVISPAQALNGFSSTAILTIAGLLVCAEGLKTTGVLDWVGHKLLGQVKSERPAHLRLVLSLVPTSAFVLNTALVAMMSPVVLDWCRKRNISPSRMMLPVSYLSILGGVCTLVGTSTTLVVNGELVQQHYEESLRHGQLLIEPRADDDLIARSAAFVDNVRPMKLFEIGRVGLPCAVLGSIVLFLLGPFLLPNIRGSVANWTEERREYLVEMFVQSDCSLIDQTVEAAGLRQLPGLFLIEIDREGQLITPVAPTDIIHGGDRLVFTGIVGTIVDLEKIPGLVPTADLGYEAQPAKKRLRNLTEVVLSRTCPLNGSTVRDGTFRQRYNAAVVAVHRNGVRLTNKIGDISLEPGDTLLLQTSRDFMDNFRNSRDFYLISPVEGSTPRRHDKSLLAGSLGLLLILWLCVTGFADAGGIAAGFSSPAIAAMSIAGFMVMFRCLSINEARSAIDLSLLVTIAGALGMATALNESGAAQSIANRLVNFAGGHPMLLLIVVYLLGMVLTEIITNNAVAAILTPIAISVAWSGGYNPRPFIMAIALSASLSFLTPFGYQTNLMVMGPGNYRPHDYLRVGWPVALVVATVSLVLIPMIWSF